MMEKRPLWQRIQCRQKKTDGSEVFVSVSDYVRGMMERGAVRLNDETGYLEDTSTGQKVDPETGERLTETPAQLYRTILEMKKIQRLRKTRDSGNPGESRNSRGSRKPDTPENPETPENQKLQKSRIHRKIQRLRKNQKLQKSRIARIPANPIPKIRFRNRILIRQILPKTGKIQRPTQFREVRSTIHRRSAKQKKRPVRTNQKLQSVILN